MSVKAINSLIEGLGNALFTAQSQEILHPKGIEISSEDSKVNIFSQHLVVTLLLISGRFQGRGLMASQSITPCTRQSYHQSGVER